MKRKGCQWIALVLTMMMLISVAGCGTPAASVAATATAAATTASVETTAATEVATPTADESATAAPAAVPAKDPVTLKVYSEQSFPGQFTSGPQTDEVSMEIVRVTGVTLDWDMSPTPDKSKILLASGDLPDIYIANSTNFLDSMVKSQYVVDLKALVASNGPDIAQIAPKAIAFSQDKLSNGTGGLYFLPGRVSGKEGYNSPVIGLFMRWDYFKEIGSPVIKSNDDVIKAVAAIYKNHPKTEDGQTVFGFSPWQDWGVWHTSVLHDNLFGQGGWGSAGSVGYTNNNNNFKFIDRINDDASSYWIDGDLYSKAYRQGLLDPDSFTQKYDGASAKMNAGRVVCQVAQWLADPVSAELQKKGLADAGYVSIPFEGGVFSGSNYNPIGLASYWSVSANCKTPDRAVDVINYFFSEEGSRTMLSGIKGKHWNVENGKASLTKEGLAAKDAADRLTTSGIHKFQNLTGLDQMTKDSNGQFVDLALEPDVQSATLSPVKKDWLAHYGADSENNLWVKYGAFAGNTGFAALAPALTDDLKRVDAKVDTYLRSALMKLWMSKTDEEFKTQKEKIQADVNKIADYSKLVEFAKKAVEDTNAEIAKY